MNGKAKAAIVSAAIASVALAIVVWILIFQGLSPFSLEEPESSRSTFALGKVTYLPDSNRTHLYIDNTSGRELYNVTLTSEFGEIHRMQQEFEPGKEEPEPNLVRGDRLGIGFTGKISKVAIGYSFEPHGEILEETLEWTW
jgi:hypothetical protein